MPGDLEQKIDRLLAIEEIRQLPCRYALAVDARDIDTLVSLFSKNVRVTREESGREAMRKWWDGVLSRFGTSIHLVGNHVIDYEGGDEATGLVYSRPEHDLDGKWMVVCMTYQDRYIREEGKWLFKSRRPRQWYAADVLERPKAQKNMLHWPHSPDGPSQMEGFWPTFDEFFERLGVVPGELIPARR